MWIGGCKARHTNDTGSCNKSILDVLLVFNFTSCLFWNMEIIHDNSEGCNESTGICLFTVFILMVNIRIYV